MIAASASDAAGCNSSMSEPTEAGSLGSDDVSASQPITWLTSASVRSQPNAGHTGCSVSPPKTRPYASAATAAPAVASAIGPATCGDPVDDRRRVMMNAA